MITLTNKQTNYSVANEDANIKLTGSVSFTEQGRIISFNGTFMTEEVPYVGNFYYNENENGKSNRSVSDVDTDKYEDADALLDTTIKELKTAISEL